MQINQPRGWITVVTRITLIGLLLAFGATQSSLSFQQSSARRLSLFDIQHHQAVEKNPDGISLLLRLEGNRTEWQQGETIKLELAFASTEPDTYTLNTARYDRSGRLWIDTFHLDPQDGAVDPLSDYFHSGKGSMGGLSGRHPLAGQPYLVNHDLNEWLSFTKPGRYRLYVTSGRISRASTPEKPTIDQPSLTVTSNIIEFEVVPSSSAWAEQTLHGARVILGSPHALGEDIAHRTASRTLRFLSTKEAAQEMIRLFRGSDGECDFQYYFGLISSPHREIIVREMEKGIRDASHPISTLYLDTLARLAVNLQPSLQTPLYPTGDAAKIKVWQAQFRRNMDARNDSLMKYVGQLKASISSKQGEARATSLTTLLEIERRHPATKTAAITAWLEKPETELAAVYFDLPPEQQSSLLQSNWKKIAGPAMLPVLRRLYENPPPTVERSFRDVVLKRLYELSPSEGRQLILDEIRQANPRVGIRALGLLPEKTLPELDGVIASHLEKSLPREEEETAESADSEEAEKQMDASYERSATTEVNSQLVERYASPAVFSRIKAAYTSIDANRWPCIPQAALLAYLLRADAATGKEMVKRAVAARNREQSLCYLSVLMDVASRYMCPELEDIAVALLNDADPEMVARAAEMLGRYGAASAEEKLWQRLERWHHEWRSRAHELRDQQPGSPSDGASPLAVQVLVESALMRALSYGTAWMLDAEKRRRLRALCLTRHSLQETEKTTKEEKIIRGTLDSVYGHIINISMESYNLPSITLLKLKLAQFPVGTTFKWQSYHHDDPAEQRLYDELKRHLEEQGMKLYKQ